jgi:thiosulfate/3-mercaptopyruvate sulfurtransferase
MVPMSRIGLLIALCALLAPPVQAQQARLLVSTDWLQDNLDRPDLVILHATNDRSEYEAEHIPGARLLLLDRIAWEGETGLGVELRGLSEIRSALEEVGVKNGSTIVVYGSNPLFAARLWMTLDVVGAGAAEPLFLDGGLPVWKEEGRPLTAETTRVVRGTLTLRPNPKRLVTAEWILVRLGHDGLSLVDARTQEEFSGTDRGPGDSLNPGHIPSARQLPWEKLVVSREHPVFLPVGQLADLFVAAGADPGDTVVTYCQAGLRASVDYMIARMLGYETHLFDGSWMDWGSRDYPHYPRRSAVR